MAAPSFTGGAEHGECPLRWPQTVAPSGRMARNQAVQPVADGFLGRNPVDLAFPAFSGLALQFREDRRRGLPSA